MADNSPEPDVHADGLYYEGRRLANQDEEVVDQGLDFDLQTLRSRRNVLGLFSAGAGLFALAACGSSGTSDRSGATATATTNAPSTNATSGSASSVGEVTTIPQETAGPYPGDGSNGADVLEMSGVVRSDIRTSLDGSDEAAGVAMTLRLVLIDVASGTPLSGAAVYVWHCDAQGRYSMYSSGVQDQTWLRGVQVSGDDGAVEFTSIFPACYPGRWPHVHFEVYPDAGSITESSNAIATSQVALPQSVCTTVYERSDYPGSTSNLAQLSLATDNVFSDDQGIHQLASVTGDVESGYTVMLNVGVRS